jgi:hypothetical protein
MMRLGGRGEFVYPGSRVQQSRVLGLPWVPSQVAHRLVHRYLTRNPL